MSRALSVHSLIAAVALGASLALVLMAQIAPGRAEARAPLVAAAGDVACGLGHSRMNPDGTGTGPNACRHVDTADLLAASGPYDAVLPLGDLIEPDSTLEAFEELYAPTWGAFRDTTWPALGNHEYDVQNARGYFDYFNGPRVRWGPAGHRGRGWHAHRLGSWLLIALNSSCNRVGCGRDGKQIEWLRQVLRKNVRNLREGNRNGSKCVMAYWHHPQFSSGSRGGQQHLGPFWDILYRHGADLVLNGHEHLYERFAPLNPSGDVDRYGMRQITVGTGGRSLFRFGDAVASGSQVRVERQFGVLRLLLRPDSYRWQFLGTDRRAHDAGERRCSARLPLR